MQNLAIGASVTLHLDGRKVQASFSFASREHPFLVTVSLFGGGGFLALEVEGNELQQLEAQLDFGAAASLDLVVASASVSVTAGIHVILTDKVDIDGFFRATARSICSASSVSRWKSTLRWNTTPARQRFSAAPPSSPCESPWRSSANH